MRKPLIPEEHGFATLVVAITFVIILSLITVGFAQLMRNEQNQATNRQLSNQAYYAAESGINDAIRALADGFQGAKKTCGPITGNNDLADNNIDTTPSGTKGNVQWTCLLIDPSPSNLEYGAVDTTNPTVFTAGAVQGDHTTPATVNTITVQWRDADDTVSTFRSNSGVANNAFPASTNWNSTGAVRISITPLAALDRATMASQTFTAYLYPSTSTDNTSTVYSTDPSDQGQILNGGCSVSASSAFYCQATIDVSSLNQSNFLFTLRSLYSKTHVSVTADGPSTTGTYFNGAQVVIDSTGRAQDVLKRIRVRVPDASHYDYPGFALDSVSGICKILQVWPRNAQSGDSACPFP